MKQYLMAIDAGTGSVRAVLFDLKGHQLGCVQREWTHGEDPRYPGSMDFDWTFNWDLTRACVRGVLEKTGVDAADIAAISSTCMREGIVLYNAKKEEIWACANVDARSQNETAELVKSDEERQKSIYAQSGQTYALGALPRLLWVKNTLPEVYENTAYISMFNDWILYKLSGTLTSEPSNACTTGIFSLDKRAWEPSIAASCGLKDDIFPPVAESGTVIGAVSDAAAAETGLASGTPLVAGGGDAQLGCVGLGLIKPGQAAVFGGSFWQYEYNTDKPQTDENCRVRVNCHAVPGVWQFEALAFYPGLVMRWYRDAFCQLEKMQAEEQGVDPYQIMDEHAAKVPAGCNGMQCAFSDVMNYISWKHASPTFTNFSIDPTKHDRYTFYRAIMENACLVTKGHLELVHEVTGNMPSEILFANGASKSPLWCQILADVLELPVKVPKVKEASALGTAVLAGVGAGVYKSASDVADSLLEVEKVYTPNAANQDVYRAAYKAWKEIYAVQLGLADAQKTKHMWSAPGLSG